MRPDEKTLNEWIDRYGLRDLFNALLLQMNHAEAVEVILQKIDEVKKAEAIDFDAHVAFHKALSKSKILNAVASEDWRSHLKAWSSKDDAGKRAYIEKLVKTRPSDKESKLSDEDAELVRDAGDMLKRINDAVER